MKTSKIMAAALLALLAAAGAHAETYSGVAPMSQGRARSDVHSEAATLRVANPYADGASMPVVAAVDPKDRAGVVAEAVAAAHAPNQNLDRKAFVNSTVPSAYAKPTLSLSRQANL